MADVQKIIADAAEEAIKSISAGEDADGMNVTVLDTIAAWRDDDGTQAAELIYDQSADVADAIIAALNEAGLVIVPRDATEEMVAAGKNTANRHAYNAFPGSGVRQMWDIMVEKAVNPMQMNRNEANDV
jgi:hypothetical protein